MRKYSRSFWPAPVMVAAFLLMAGQAAASSVGPRRGPTTGEEEVDLVAVVERIYEQVEALSVGSGLEVELSGFRTDPAASFEELGLSEVVDPVTAERGVQLVRQVERRQVPTAGLDAFFERVVLHPEWVSAPVAVEAVDAARFPSVQALLGFVADDYPEVGTAFALTSFDVSLSLAGEVRRYRASFLWLGSPGSPRFQALDPMIRGLQSLAAEALILADRDRESGRRLAKRVGTRRMAAASSDSESAVCIPGDVTFAGSPKRSASDNHSGGAHQSSANFQGLCRCDSDCSQTCRTSIVGTECKDTPIALNGAHILSSSTMVDNQSTSAGHRSPVTCLAGYGCVMKICQFGGLFCDVSVSVGKSGGSVTFSSPSGFDWEGNLEFTAACPPCEVVEEEPNDPPPPSGGGEDEPMDECTCDCDGDGWVTPEECVFDCDGEVNGEWCDV